MGEPQVTLTPENCWCPRHLEPFRKTWPKGYGLATPLIFTAFCAVPDVVRYCGGGPDTKGDTNRLQSAIAEFGPCCCAIAGKLRRRITRVALAGDVEAVKAIHAEILGSEGIDQP